MQRYTFFITPQAIVYFFTYIPTKQQNLNVSHLLYIQPKSVVSLRCVNIPHGYHELLYKRWEA